MKIKRGYILRNVAKTHIVVPVAQNTLNYRGMLSLNEAGAFLWKLLEKGADRERLLSAMLSEYDVSESVAAADIEAFLDSIRNMGALEE